MSATHENNELAIRALADEEFDAVSGGDHAIPVSNDRGRVIWLSPTTDYGRIFGPFGPGSTGPTFPTFPD